MKGNADVIAGLNQALAEELAAINQYMVHSEMAANWNYSVLHQKIEKRAIQEMKHAESLIARILFLEGVPVVTKLGDISIGPSVEPMLTKDLAAETKAIDLYRRIIEVCLKAGDVGTRELLEDILKDEEAHLDELESQLDQVSQMGLQNFLANQTTEKE